jgi:SpoIIAA-like
MLEFIPSNEEVLAIKTGGRITRAELDEVTTRLERSLDAREKTHLFVEVDNFTGLDWAALPDYLPRAFGMISKLSRFGRVAIVSDQDWIRWASKIESAILPHISYETFKSDKRDAAFAWVEQGGEPPRG